MATGGVGFYYSEFNKSIYNPQNIYLTNKSKKVIKVGLKIQRKCKKLKLGYLKN